MAGRYTVIEMPMTKDHKGPACKDETAYILFDVTDLFNFESVYQHRNKADAEYIAGCLNVKEEFEKSLFPHATQSAIRTPPTEG